MKMAGTTGLAASVAGCSGNQGDGNDGTTDGGTQSTGDNNKNGGGKPVDPVYSTRVRSGILPNELQWNQYNSKNKSWVTNQFWFDRLAIKRNDGEYVPSLAKSWKVTENKMTITLQDDAHWHDGTPVTAQHVKDKMDIELGMGATASNFIDGAKAVGEKTVELSLPEPRNRDLLQTVILSIRINTPPNSKFGTFAKRFRNADSEEKKKEVQKEVSSYKLTDPVGNGPFKFEKATPSKLTAKKHRKYHYADRVAVPKLEAHKAKGGQPWAEMRNDNVDGVAGDADPKVSKQFPDHIRHDLLPSVGGYGFLLNFDHPSFQDWRARQAMCWLHDPKRTQSGSSNPDNLMTPPPVGHNFANRLSDKVRNNLNQYNEGPKPQKAASLFKEAGFTKRNGKWYQPNGERFKIVLDNSGDPTYQTPFKNQLEEFGIKAEIDTKSSSVWAEDFFNGDFQVFVSWWGASMGPDHPWFQMQWEWDPGIDQYVEPMGKDVENFPVPMPVGDPNGTIREVNVLERFRKLGSAVSEDEFQKHLDFLSWAWNQTGCSPQIWTGTHNHWADTKDWNWPSTKEMQRGPMMPYFTGFRTGDLTPKTK